MTRRLKKVVIVQDTDGQDVEILLTPSSYYIRIIDGKYPEYTTSDGRTICKVDGYTFEYEGYTIGITPYHVRCCLAENDAEKTHYLVFSNRAVKAYGEDRWTATEVLSGIQCGKGSSFIDCVQYVVQHIDIVKNGRLAIEKRREFELSTPSGQESAANRDINTIDMVYGDMMHRDLIMAAQHSQFANKSDIVKS